MGQKVHPISFRLGITKSWDSRWFAGEHYSDFVLEDYNIRKFLKKRVSQAGISKIEIERAASKVRIRMYVARPGIVIGKKGIEIEKLKTDLEKLIKREVILDIQEVRKAEVDAQLVAENVAMQLVRRVAFRRAMKKSVSSALRFGAQGIKISCSGQIGWSRNGKTGMVQGRKSSPSYTSGGY